MAGHQAPRPGDFPGKNTGVGCHFFLQRMKVKSESEVAQSGPTLSDPWTAAYQAPPSMGFSRQEYWSGVPLPSPRKGYSGPQIRDFYLFLAAYNPLLPFIWLYQVLAGHVDSSSLSRDQTPASYIGISDS